MNCFMASVTMRADGRERIGIDSMDGEDVDGYIFNVGVQGESAEMAWAVLGKVIGESSREYQASLRQVEVDSVDANDIQKQILENGGACDMGKDVFYRSGNVFFSDKRPRGWLMKAFYVLHAFVRKYFGAVLLAVGVLYVAARVWMASS